VMNGFITFYAQRAFMLSKRTGVLALTMVLPVLINIGLNLIWIPAYGLMGAVWATLVAYMIGLVISFAVARRYFPLPLPVKTLAQTTFACAVMAGAVLALPANLSTLPDLAELLIKAGVGACVYGLVAFALNIANCRALIKDMIAKIKDKKSPKKAGAAA